MKNQAPNNPSCRSDASAKPMAFEEIPFVYRPHVETEEDKRSNWKVSLTDDYADACEVGRN